MFLILQMWERFWATGLSVLRLSRFVFLQARLPPHRPAPIPKLLLSRALPLCLGLKFVSAQERRLDPDLAFSSVP